MNRLTEMKTIIRKYPVALLVMVCLALCLILGLTRYSDSRKKKAEHINDKTALYVDCPKLAHCADSFLLKKGGFHVLLDTGEVGDSDIILHMLEDHEVDKIQALILSHFDKDHIGGAARILEAIPVEKCYMPKGEEDSDAYRQLMAALEKSDTEIVIVSETMTFTENEVTFTIQPPLSTQYEKDFDNNNSLIVEVEAAGKNLLFAGDAEKERLDEYFTSQYSDKKFDFLKVPHHGRDKEEIKGILEHFVPTHALITSSVDEPEKKGVTKALRNKKVKTWLTRMDSVELKINEYGLDINYSNTMESQTEEGSDKVSYSSKEEPVYISELPEPVFSKDSGFYDEEFDLTIEAPEGCKVYYTVDSSEPTTESKEYTDPIHIYDRTEEPNVYSMNEHMMPFTKNKIIPNQKPIIPGYYLMRRLPEGQVEKCMVVRAVAVNAEGTTSDVVTKSYFVGYNKKAGYENIGVMSIVSNPDGLFSDENGIMVTGSRYLEKLANGGFKNVQEARKYMNCFSGRGKAWEREALLEYFGEEDKGLQLSQKVGIRLHGNMTRVTYVHKSFNLYARREYDGNNTFKIPFFDNGFLMDSVTLMRGNGIRNYYLIDKLNGRTMPTQQYRMVQVFLDGEYWGLYAIQERYSDEYIKLHYDVDDEEYILIDNDTKGLHVESGDEENGMNKFKEFQTFVKDHDFSDPKNYEELCNRMDMQSFLDCYCAKIYTGDFDWNWNRNLYIFYCNGKWHWITYDIDHAASYMEQSDPEVNSFWQTRTVSDTNTLYNDPFFTKFVYSEEFRKDFTNTFMDMANGVFDAKTVTSDMEAFKENYWEASMKSLKRYPLLKESVEGAYRNHSSYYTKHCDLISEFFQKRMDYAPYYLRNYFKMEGEFRWVTLFSDHPEGGKVEINTLKPTLDPEEGWSGKYLTSIPVTVTAVPEEGWTFAGWQSENGTFSDSAALTTELSFNVDVKVTACFKKISQ